MSETRIEIKYPSEEEQATTGFMQLTVEEILNNIKVGMTLHDCACLVGLKPSIVKGWYNRNYCGFAEVVDTAMALNKRLHIGRIHQAKDRTQVNASTWWLERKHKDEFSKEVTVIVNHVLIDNVSSILKDLLIKYIKEPETLKLAAQEFRERIGQVKQSDMPARMITDGDKSMV